MASRSFIKITNSVVDRIPLVQSGQILYWDADLSGFGLCVGATAKSYIVQRTMGGRGLSRRTVRITIGKHGVFTPEEARREARDLLNRIARGEDPRETKRVDAARALTLRQAWQQFAATRRLRPKAQGDYRRTVERDLQIWLDRPLASITGSELVEDYVRQSERLGRSMAARNMRTFRAIYN